jgi:putative peptidoglycan lipid II flippase
VNDDAPKPPPASPLRPEAVDAPATDAPNADDPIAQSLAPEAAPGGGGRAMAKSSLIYSGMTLLSRFMGFFRDLVVTAAMGASSTVAADAWNTALMFPNLFRRIFAEGAFAAAFVPAYAKALADGGEEKADLLAGDAMAALAAATVTLTVVAEITMPWLMYVISPGFASNPEKFHLAVVLTMITMPYLPCMAIYAHLSGVLNARGRFVASGFAPVLLNVFTLVAVLPQKDPIAAAFAAAIGAITAGVAQAALLWWSVRRSGASVHLRWPRLTPEIKGLIGLAVPGAIAASATQINVFVSNMLVSQVNGARTWLSVADRLWQLPLGLVGVAIGVALLPRMSVAVQRNDKAEQQLAMDEAIGFSLALCLPAAAALVGMPFFLIDGLFTRGEFLAHDASATAQLLFHYGWGVPAFVLARVLAPAFFARSDTKAPMRFAIISMAINIGLGIGLFQLVGVQGIAAATAIASWITVGQMFLALGRRGHYVPGRSALTRIAKVLIASVAMGVVVALASTLRPVFEPWLLGWKELALLVTCIVGAGVYAVLLISLKAVTPAEIRATLRRRPRDKGAAASAGPPDLS